MKKEASLRILVSEDEEQKRKINESATHFIPLLSQVVKQWDLLGIGALETEYLSEAVHEPKKLYDRVVLALVPDVVEETVGPFKKKVSKSLEGLELPDPSSFYAAAKKAHDWDVNNHLSTEDFKIVGDKISFKDLEKIYDQRARVWAESQLAKEFYEAQTDLQKSLEKFNAFTEKVGAMVFLRPSVAVSSVITIGDHFNFIDPYFAAGEFKITLKTRYYHMLNKIPVSISATKQEIEKYDPRV